MTDREFGNLVADVAERCGVSAPAVQVIEGWETLGVTRHRGVLHASAHALDALPPAELRFAVALELAPIPERAIPGCRDLLPYVVGLVAIGAVFAVISITLEPRLAAALAAVLLLALPVLAAREAYRRALRYVIARDAAALAATRDPEAAIAYLQRVGPVRRARIEELQKLGAGIRG